MRGSEYEKGGCVGNFFVGILLLFVINAVEREEAMGYRGKLYVGAKVEILCH